MEKLNGIYTRVRFYKFDDISDCVDYIYGKQAGINKYVEHFEYQKRLNMRDFRISSFFSSIPLVEFCKSPDFFEEDSLDIELGIEVSTDYLHYYNKLLELITDSNYVEIARLASFMGDLYNYNIRQLEGNRAGRERFYRGEGDFGVCKLINKDLVDTFFCQQINSMTNKDSVEKVKK